MCGTLEAGGLQGVIVVPGSEVRISVVVQEELGGLEPVLLDRVVQRSLVLDVGGVDVGSVFQEKSAELDALDRVYETGAAVVVRPQYVRPVLNQVGYDF